jgi:hypothetical protein
MRACAIPEIGGQIFLMKGISMPKLLIAAEK